MLVGIGGACGGICRFARGRWIARKADTDFPAGPFLVTISGAVLLGILTRVSAGGSAYLLLGDGFLGAYTTFSTFMYEGFHLFQDNEIFDAFVYILGTLFLGVIGYAAGYLAGNLFPSF
jgi:CrcB protein